MISTAIKAKREAKGWSKKYLGDLIGVSSAAIGQYEKGDNKPKIEVILKLNKVFDYDFINDKPINERAGELSQKSNIAQKANINLNETGVGFKDIEQLNTKLTYSENSTFPERNKLLQRPERIDINKWIDPNHAPIPVYDNTYGAVTITELLENDLYKPTVILLKGHLGCDTVIRHTDRVMYKDFPEKCQLGIERLFEFKEIIEFGKPHIVVLKELRLTRYVYLSDDEKHFILRTSDPEKYPDMKVHKEKVSEMWVIKSVTPIPESQLY